MNHKPTLSLNILEEAIKLDAFDAATAHKHMMPAHRGQFPDAGDPSEAGVLVLVYPDKRSELQLVLTLRDDSLRGHSGQVSFPGGRRDPEDHSFSATALRETCEELGICDNSVKIIGELSKIYIPPSNFNVYPTVGYMTDTPEFRPNPQEVAEVFSVSLHDLLDSRFKREEDWLFQGFTVRIPFYAFQGHKVWGATAIMLSELEHRLRFVLDQLNHPKFDSPRH